MILVLGSGNRGRFVPAEQNPSATSCQGIGYHPSYLGHRDMTSDTVKRTQDQLITEYRGSP